MPQPTFLTGLTVANGEPLIWGRRTYVMGIINVTGDSFSGDGLGSDLQAIAELAVRFQEEGADLLDVGAESTRPGSTPITVQEELDRLLPALETIISRVSLPISVDTYKAPVARQAVQAGAVIINDVWGLKKDPDIAMAAAESGAGLIIMHNQETTSYRDLVPDVLASLSQSLESARAAGVPQESIILDPGIGFGKTADHNLEILSRLGEFKTLGCPLLVGTSRKSTIGRVLDLPPDQRMEGTAATVALSIAAGADMVRVHDVREMTRVCRMTDAVVRGWRPQGWTP
ncbi:MAG: dihydropteroate synthase [Chloroflexi bacterium]|nr:dihydropteroate synthase [Chloroflexota bacterium]